MELYQLYNPITATPFACNPGYMEWQPCAALKPYIKCFWGTKVPVKQEKTGIITTGIVTPDTCMDIIFHVDYTNNRSTGCFCGIDDRTFETHNRNDEEKLVATYAIRFYAWSAVLFSEESMRDVRNGFFDAGYHFSKIKKEIEPQLFDVESMVEFITLAERTLLKYLQKRHENTYVTETIGRILDSKGSVWTERLAKEIHISNRHMERLFREYIGVSPKNLASMVRYQYLWNDILYESHFDVQDAVLRYGYTDQAHLLHEFKKFHSMNITEAKRYAMKDVVFLQV